MISLIGVKHLNIKILVVGLRPASTRPVEMKINQGTGRPVPYIIGFDVCFKIVII